MWAKHREPTGRRGEQEKQVNVWEEKRESGRTVQSLAIPTLIGTIAISTVTVVDGIFVGYGVGPDGVAAVNISAPICELMSGIGIMMGIGCSVVCSILLTKRKTAAARRCVTQSIIVATMLAIIFCMVVLTSPRSTATFLGSSETLMPQVIDYLTLAVWRERNLACHASGGGSNCNACRYFVLLFSSHKLTGLNRA